jgi:hypothetical protein
MARGKFDHFMIDVHIGSNRKIRRLTIAERWCHVAGVLALAAQAPIRGRLLVGDEEATPQDYAELAGVSANVARSAVQKLRGVGVIVPDEEYGCERIHDWDDSNPDPRRDPTAADRQHRYRERRKHRNGVTDVTHPQAVTVTPGREEKVKEEAKASSSSGTDRADEKATDEDRRLCRLLGELAKERNSKFKVKSRGRWLTDMRLLRERDDNAPDEIERLLRWLFTDTGRDATFWADVIQSPGNLREHFPQLWAKMHAQPLRAVAAVEDSAAFLARRGVA